MDTQDFINSMRKITRDARAAYHLTLGKAIELLAAMPTDMPVEFSDGTTPHAVASYRGYYEDLAVSNCEGVRSVRDLLDVLRPALGATFTGYKGGKYVVEQDTPLWQAEPGDASSVAIIGLEEHGGKAVLVTKDVD